MKSIPNVVVLLLLLLVPGCIAESPLIPPAVHGSGKLLFRVDRVQAPAGIATVTAVLKRNGYDSLSATMNFLSDTAASISFAAVPAGVWSLRVDARDSGGVLRYTGGTDVLVTAQQTTEVMLLLQPVTQGTGSIVITVGWGSGTPGRFTDYSLNPILTPPGNGYDAGGVDAPVVLSLPAGKRMFFQYSGNSGTAAGGMAVSLEGLEWVLPSASPVLLPTANSWDSYLTAPTAACADGDTVRVYYAGKKNYYSALSAGVAVAIGGGPLVKYPYPVFSPAPGDAGGVTLTTVIKAGTVYYGYYTIAAAGGKQIGLATSADGYSFTPFAGNPVITGSAPWETGGVCWPSVILENGTFTMVYMNYPSGSPSFGLATSTDGIRWSKDSGNPVFAAWQTYGNWTSYIQSPRLCRVNGKQYIYYTGLKQGKEVIGVARER